MRKENSFDLYALATLVGSGTQDLCSARVTLKLLQMPFAPHPFPPHPYMATFVIETTSVATIELLVDTHCLCSGRSAGKLREEKFSCPQISPRPPYVRGYLL